MTTFTLQSEATGQYAKRHRARRRVQAYIAQTWRLWFCWGMFLNDGEPDWSGPGMIWKHGKHIGKVLFGRN